jgi:hypothetical protein
MYGAGYVQICKCTSTRCTPHIHPWVCTYAYTLSFSIQRFVLKSLIKIKIQLFWQVSVLQTGEKVRLYHLLNITYKNLTYKFAWRHSPHLHAGKERISLHRIIWCVYVQNKQTNTQTHTHTHTHTHTQSNRIIPYDPWFDYQNQAKTIWVSKIPYKWFSHQNNTGTSLWSKAFYKMVRHSHTSSVLLLSSK